MSNNHVLLIFWIGNLLCCFMCLYAYIYLSHCIIIVTYLFSYALKLVYQFFFKSRSILSPSPSREFVPKERIIGTDPEAEDIPSCSRKDDVEPERHSTRKDKVIPLARARRWGHQRKCRRSGAQRWLKPSRNICRCLVRFQNFGFRLMKFVIALEILLKRHRDDDRMDAILTNLIENV